MALAGFTKLYVGEIRGCVAEGDGQCSPGSRLLKHIPDQCGAGDYSDDNYGFCPVHAGSHARNFHHKAETVQGFSTMRSTVRDGILLLRIRCLRCGRNAVEGSVSSEDDWTAAHQMVLLHNEGHARRFGAAS